MTAVLDYFQQQFEHLLGQLLTAVVVESIDDVVKTVVVVRVIAAEVFLGANKSNKIQFIFESHSINFDLFHAKLDDPLIFGIVFFEEFDQVAIFILAASSSPKIPQKRFRFVVLVF